MNFMFCCCCCCYQEAGTDLEPSKATMIVGLMQFFGNFLSMLLIDKLGRRILLMMSGGAMGTCTLILGIYFHWIINDKVSRLIDSSNHRSIDN